MNAVAITVRNANASSTTRRAGSTISTANIVRDAGTQQPVSSALTYRVYADMNQLGLQMRAKKATLIDVKNRLEFHKQRLRQKPVKQEGSAHDIRLVVAYYLQGYRPRGEDPAEAQRGAGEKTRKEETKETKKGGRGFSRCGDGSGCRCRSRPRNGGDGI